MQNQPNPVVIIQKHFSKPPHKIWQAWTDAEIIRRWFGSDPNGTVLGVFLDVRLGGSFEITFANADGTSFTCFGVYTAVEPSQKLSFTWSWKSSPSVVEFVRVQLQEELGGTLMDFEIANIDPNSAHHYAAGWQATFEKLAKALKT